MNSPLEECKIKYDLTQQVLQARSHVVNGAQYRAPCEGWEVSVQTNGQSSYSLMLRYSIYLSSINLLKASYVLVTGADTIYKAWFLHAKSLVVYHLVN